MQPLYSELWQSNQFQPNQAQFTRRLMGVPDARTDPRIGTLGAPSGWTPQGMYGVNPMMMGQIPGPLGRFGEQLPGRPPQTDPMQMRLGDRVNFLQNQGGPMFPTEEKMARIEARQGMNQSMPMQMPSQPSQPAAQPVKKTLGVQRFAKNQRM